jgi:hypothetical protein
MHPFFKKTKTPSVASKSSRFRVRDRRKFHTRHSDSPFLREKCGRCGHVRHLSEKLSPNHRDTPPFADDHRPDAAVSVSIFFQISTVQIELKSETPLLRQ